MTNLHKKYNTNGIDSEKLVTILILTKLTLEQFHIFISYS